MADRPCTLLVHFDKGSASMANEIKADLEAGDGPAKAEVMKRAIMLLLNSESLSHLFITVVRYVLPSEDHVIQKLLLLYLETVDKRDPAGGKVLPEPNSLLLPVVATPSSPPRSTTAGGVQKREMTATSYSKGAGRREQRSSEVDTALDERERERSMGENESSASGGKLGRTARWNGAVWRRRACRGLEQEGHDLEGRRLWDWTQGRLQVRREQPGHRYFHGCSPHSSHGEPLSPPPPPGPPELELELALVGGRERQGRGERREMGLTGGSHGHLNIAST